MTRYPHDQLWDELTELALHLHWSLPDLLDLEHRQRARLLSSARELKARELDATTR